jgi:tyrosyl-tRNA synthetase
MSHTDHETKLQTLLERGVENIFPNREFLEEKLKLGKALTIYCGYDPTGPTLHIGHAITLMKLRDFQELGHKVIMLIGDFTALIGDPTDKGAARVRQTREQVLENCKLYQKQASTILKFDGENPAELRFNNDWLGKLTFAEVIDLASHFTVQQMLERDMFEKRMAEEKPIYMHEFFYPLMQGYDSVAMDVDGEVGGNDQTFNMLAGRHLMKDLSGKEKFVVAGKLLVDSVGKKMGKSEGNMIAMSDSPEDMFGKVMRWSDEMIVPGFEICTRIPMHEVKEVEEAMKNGANPRDFKLNLAYHVTEMFLGDEAARLGREHFAAVIQNSEKPAEIAELKPSAYDIVTVLVEAGFVESRGEARRQIEGAGVKINDEKVESLETQTKAGDIIQKGKRFFVKIK